MGAHPRAVALEATSVHAADTAAAPAVSLVPPTHETGWLAVAGTSVLTNMTPRKTPQRRPRENAPLRQCPGLARLHRATQFNPPARSPKPWPPTAPATSTSNPMLQRPRAASLTAPTIRIALQRCN